MKYLFYFLFLFSSFISCESILYKQLKHDPPSKPPNEPIKEIRFNAHYWPKNTEEEKRAIKIDYDHCLLRRQKEENPHKHCEYLKAREEDSVHFESKAYCYDIKQDKESPFKKNLKARLYDKEGNILVEDYLRCDRNLDGTETCDKETTPHLNFYLPYSKQAYEMKVIKTEGAKEIVLNEIKLLSYEEIRKSVYSKLSKCHHIGLSPIL